MPDDTLADLIDQAFNDGIDEITICVSRYADDMKTVEAVQAITKNRNRTMAWGVGVLAKPSAAIREALRHAPRNKPTVSKYGF